MFGNGRFLGELQMTDDWGCGWDLDEYPPGEYLQPCGSPEHRELYYYLTVNVGYVTD